MVDDEHVVGVVEWVVVMFGVVIDELMIVERFLCCIVGVG